MVFNPLPSSIEVSDGKVYVDLESVFDEVNYRHFEGILRSPVLMYNSRLRSSAGRFIPGRKQMFYERPPLIEIARYLLDEPKAYELILDTMGHEMIHYWLWLRRQPYGHTPEFWKKMTEMGVSRYNTAPKIRPYKYLYRCKGCDKDFPTRKRLGTLACSDCCKKYAGGKFDPRFKLYIYKTLDKSEGLEISMARRRSV